MDSKQHAAWSGEDDEILIDFVREHESLYNILLKEYRNNQCKQRLWHEIGEILKRTDVECSKRWVYVRDYYIRRRGKPGTGSSGEAAKKRSDQLSFLDSCSSGKRSTISNIIGKDTQIIEENSIDDIGPEGNLSNMVSHINEESEDLSNESVLGSPQDQIFTRLSNIDSPSPKRKYSTAKSKNSDERMKLLRDIAERNREPVIEQDVNDLFFASMTKMVKKLPEVEQSKIRIQIANIVGNAEIEFLTGCTNRPLSGSSYTSTYYDKEMLIPVQSCSTPHARINDQYNLNLNHYQ